MDKKLLSQNESIVKLEKVSKTYRLDGVTIEAVKEISLEIFTGEFTSIVGPSGSGKSTLMHLIGLLDKPTTGTITVEGERTEKLSEAELAKLRNQKIGFVFQTFNLLPRISALANVMLPLQYSRISGQQREELAKNLLEKVGLSARLKSHPSQLSGGEAQRVAIARALVCNPTIILADEPTGNLDSKSGGEILEILANLNKEGKTVLVVTHDQKIASFTKRLINLVDGQIVSDKKNQ